MTGTQMNWYGPDAATFGDRISAAREASGLNQTQLAKSLGVKLATLKGWEQDLSEPRANKLSMLAGLLNVSVMWLLNGEGEGVDDPNTKLVVEKGLNDMLLEMRELRTVLKGSSDRLGMLEKRFREQLRRQE
ncbi:helix-turn-helix domain-containing protein [Paracoccaceae bacterium]|nr:helix-turn-helix domain-containing protein [Paracoccaceae bacterium]